MLVAHFAAVFEQAVDISVAVDGEIRIFLAGRQPGERVVGRDAVIDLQRFIPGYRSGNSTTFKLADVTAVGQASLVQMPVGALPKELYILSLDTAKQATNPLCKRYRLDFYPWRSRQDMVCGRLDFTNWWVGGFWPNGCPPVPTSCCGITWLQSKAYVYTMAPHGKNFLVYPGLNDTTAVLLVWDGYKTEFGNTDTIPFPDGAAEAVANYVKWRIALEVDKNIALSREFQGAWRERRLSLYRDWQETQDAEGDGDEYDQTDQPVDTNIKSGTVGLASGNTTAAVVFGAAFAAAPFVDCWITDSTGAVSTINAFADPATITANGFTALFTGSIPTAGYSLAWNASATPQ